MSVLYDTRGFPQRWETRDLGSPKRNGPSRTRLEILNGNKVHGSVSRERHGSATQPDTESETNPWVCAHFMGVFTSNPTPFSFNNKNYSGDKKHGLWTVS